MLFVPDMLGWQQGIGSAGERAAANEMKEKELRLALVFYGGVSLAIYQHGVNIEILNLVRASKAYHEPRGFAEKQSDSHVFANPAGDCSTDAVYFDLLKTIGKSLDLRIIVDVISGSSAGGINGIALARAVAHDLTLAPLTELWFAKADLLQLIAPEARATMWSKWYFWPLMRPLLSRLRREGLLPDKPDAEIRDRVSTFLRSRWFKPPFDGAYFSNLLIDGLAAMEGPRPSTSTLLPTELRLDLMITVTDYHGADQAIYLHDPAIIHEREHRQLLHFQAETSQPGLARSDFELGNIPSLAFAGRASASYPGAFPPAQLQEMDDIVAQRKLPWTGRSRFLKANFQRYQDGDTPAEATILLDGSILNNKPIFAAIAAIRTHGAYREVDRRLVYIDPHPDRPTDRAVGRSPGFFTTLRGALSDLPRHDPIYEELATINRFNDQISRLKDIISMSRPQVEVLIEEATGGDLSGDITLEQLRNWRLTSTNLLSRSPIVYNVYVRSLVLEAADFISDLVSRECGYPRQSQNAHLVRKIIEKWCDAAGMFPENYHIPDNVAADADLPLFAKFIVDFGIKYKRRRLTFILQDINNLYAQGALLASCGTTPAQLDQLKKNISNCRRSLAACEEPGFLDPESTRAIARLFAFAPSAPDPLVFVAANRAALTETIMQLGSACGLVGANDELDAIFSSPAVAEMGEACRRRVLTGYLGWAYLDVILLPAMNALELDTSTFEAVLVDRISPSDATTIRAQGATGQLQGKAAIGFGGFLSRTARENDYFWGRVHAIDRLIDIVASTVDPEQIEARPDFATFKKRAFEAMLRQETQRLLRIPDVVAAAAAAVAAL